MHHKSRYRNNYDFLRVFAAICIMFTHSFSLLARASEEPARVISNNKIDFSFIGLSIFFSISGFLIAGSALKSPSIINYLWKRLLRIQPLLIVVCLLSVLVMGPIFTELSLKDYFLSGNTWSYFRNVLPMFGLQFTLPGVFTHNIGESGVNGSLWTLIVEERLYIFMCLLFLLRKKDTFYFLLIIGVLNLFYLVNNFFYGSAMVPYFNESSFFYALIFLNSAALYMLNLDFSNSHYFYIVIGALLFALSIAFSMLHFLQFYSIPLIVNALAKIRGRLNRTGKMGDFTYGLYVFAFPVQQMLVASGYIANPYELFCFTFIITFPIAILSWHFLEKKFLRLKKQVR